MSFQLGAFQIPAFQSPSALTPVGPIITGAWAFNPDLADAFEEAFERAGIAPLAIGQEHIASALRSCRYMLNSEWSNYGMRQWMISQDLHTTTPGEVYFDLPAGAVDVFNAMLRRNGADTQMYPISRGDYDAISTKTRRGRPNQLFIDKQYNRLRVYMWQQPENSTDIVVVDYLRQMTDVGQMANGLNMPAHALECFIAGLAMNLARKFNMERYQMLRNEYGGPAYPEKLGGKLFHMRAASGERGDVQFTITRRR